jgi:hypothetical protein
MNTLAESLRLCAVYLPEPFRAEHERLFADEHLGRLAGRLSAFAEHGVPAERPLPHFAAECTPPPEEAWGFVESPVRAWQAAEDRAAPGVLRGLADALVAAGTRNLLLLLGQRLTPASLTDARAIPPTRPRLLAAANRPHGGKDPLTAAARALAKHVHRSAERFWGEVRGSAPEKNAHAEQVLNRILDDVTWWNVFGHFQHEVVYEARVPSGHGARWGWSGGEFIGFLEPFDEEKCPSLESDGA